MDRPERLAGEPGRQDRVDAAAPACPRSGGAKKTFLMIALDQGCCALPKQSYNRIGEPVLVNGVAKAEQQIDVTHQSKRLGQSGDIAVDVRDDADFHAHCSRGTGGNAALIWYRRLTAQSARSRRAARTRRARIARRE